MTKENHEVKTVHHKTLKTRPQKAGQDNLPKNKRERKEK